MNVTTILANFTAHVTAGMHKRRQQALLDAITSILSGNQLTVTAMGRGMRGRTFEKHRIKRADRLLSNPHLQGERVRIYAAIVWLMTHHLRRPIIQIDWSDLDGAKRHFLLRASLAFSSRSITLYEEVHPITTKEKPATHRYFLATLAKMLPPHCKPIVVTDAGFRVPWFRQLLALGWDFVGRVRNRDKCRQSQGDWLDCKSLYTLATIRPRHLGTWQLTASKRLRVQLVIVKDTHKARLAFTRQGQKRQSSSSKKAAKRGAEPWLLATSLAGTHLNIAKHIVACYSTRMQIEEAFRDMKSTRWGFAGNHQACRSHQRLALLMLIATLAHIVVLLLGLAVEIAGLARRYQVNTIKNRRILSLCFLGQRICQQRYYQIGKRVWLSAIQRLKAILSKVNGGCYE